MILSIFDEMNLVTEEEIQRLLPLVSEQRRDDALRFAHRFGQFACLKSYVMLREILESKGLSHPFLFGCNEHGRPFLIEHPEVHFNISHCKNGIAVAVSDEPVGIDIESFRHFDEALLRKTMNDEEIELINATPEPPESFIAYWTKKEAVLKLRGTGISTDLYQVLDGMGYRLETHIIKQKGYAWSVAYSD